MVKVIEIEKIEGEDTAGNPVPTLKIIFEKWDKQLRVLIRDIKEEDIDDNTKQAKKKAIEWFKNQENVLLSKANDE